MTRRAPKVPVAVQCWLELTDEGQRLANTATDALISSAEFESALAALHLAQARIQELEAQVSVLQRVNMALGQRCQQVLEANAQAAARSLDIVRRWGQLIRAAAQVSTFERPSPFSLVPRASMQDLRAALDACVIPEEEIHG